MRKEEGSKMTNGKRKQAFGHNVLNQKIYEFVRAQDYRIDPSEVKSMVEREFDVSFAVSTIQGIRNGKQDHRFAPGGSEYNPNNGWRGYSTLSQNDMYDTYVEGYDSTDSFGNLGRYKAQSNHNGNGSKYSKNYSSKSRHNDNSTNNTRKGTGRKIIGVILGLWGIWGLTHGALNHIGSIIIVAVMFIIAWKNLFVIK